jgi:predicted metallopeptidase
MTSSCQKDIRTSLPNFSLLLLRASSRCFFTSNCTTFITNFGRENCYTFQAIMKYSPAPEIKQQISYLVEALHFEHVKIDHIYCIRSFDAQTRAIARIWGMSKLFNEVAGLPVTYIIEVNAKKYDKLNEREKMKTLIHELMHIPKTFSGALLSHHGRYHAINDREVEKLLKAKKM